MLPVRISALGRERSLAETDLPLRLESLVAGSPDRRWEVELGFGKGRYLLEQAAARREVGFLGIEVASKYYRHVRDRAAAFDNLILVRGEALYLLASVLPPGFASVVHVYFPDPWPKARHHGRRIFDPESMDLMLRLLRPDGRLIFATDFVDYGEWVERLLRDHGGLRVTRAEDLWDGGPRTHYEDKYHREGRAILRLEARLDRSTELVHPRAGLGLVAGVAKPSPKENEENET